MSIGPAVLMCHAPIVIPEIGAERAPECAHTTRAMTQAARRWLAGAADLMVLISPHTPRLRSAWNIVTAPRLVGSFARFGFPKLKLELRGAEGQAADLLRAAREHGPLAEARREQELDHGALVPLWFFAQAGFTGPTLLVAPPHPGHDSEQAFAALLKRVAEARGERWGIVASGDMSHRVAPGAPAGYHPRAVDFDAWVVRCAERSDYEGLCEPDPGLRALAAEDVIESVRVAVHAMDEPRQPIDVLSYEAPFGVGYFEAVLYEEASAARAPSRRGERSALPTLSEVARGAIRAHLRHERYEPPELEGDDAAHGVFVTLRAEAGELRGCIGRTERAYLSLSREVADLAVRSATEDPRMVPVALSEVESLRIEVSLLGAPEPIASKSELDPEAYGVIVTSGRKRGLLLPAIEGVSEIEQQVSIASRKAGIRPGEPIKLERFRATKIIDAKPAR